MQTPATTAQPSSHPPAPSLPIVLGGRERQRPASGSLPLGLTSHPLPSRGLALGPGQSQGVGAGKGTAAASDPEQKTGVSTAGGTR